jgi:hypothetical protein
MQDKDYAGWVAIILAATLGLVLVGSMVVVIFSDRPISESASRLLTTIGAGLVGALATYVGTASRRQDRDK